MAELIDWSILGSSPDVTSVVPDDRVHGYDLFNLTDSEALVYGERTVGINLKWGDPGKSDNVRFQRESGAKDPVRFGEPVAINVRQGGFLVYEGGRNGINLGWSNTPKFEWQVLGGEAGTPVPAGKPVGLYSTVEKDSLMYEPRDWGVNLKWFKDSGKYRRFGSLIRAGKVVKEVWDAV